MGFLNGLFLKFLVSLHLALFLKMKTCWEVGTGSFPHSMEEERTLTLGTRLGSCMCLPHLPHTMLQPQPSYLLSLCTAEFPTAALQAPMKKNKNSSSANSKCFDLVPGRPDTISSMPGADRQTGRPATCLYTCHRHSFCFWEKEKCCFLLFGKRRTYCKTEADREKGTCCCMLSSERREWQLSLENMSMCVCKSNNVCSFHHVNVSK